MYGLCLTSGLRRPPSLQPPLRPQMLTSRRQEAGGEREGDVPRPHKEKVWAGPFHQLGPPSLSSRLWPQHPLSLHTHSGHEWSQSDTQLSTSSTPGRSLAVDNHFNQFVNIYLANWLLGFNHLDHKNLRYEKRRLKTNRKWILDYWKNIRTILTREMKMVCSINIHFIFLSRTTTIS